MIFLGNFTGYVIRRFTSFGQTEKPESAESPLDAISRFQTEADAVCNNSSRILRGTGFEVNNFPDIDDYACRAVGRSGSGRNQAGRWCGGICNNTLERGAGGAGGDTCGPGGVWETPPRLQATDLQFHW